jgi:hypothetical protein
VVGTKFLNVCDLESLGMLKLLAGHRTHVTIANETFRPPKCKYRIYNTILIRKCRKLTQFKFSVAKREENGSWRKLHNDELHSLYSSPNIIGVIKSRRMRWVGHVAHMGMEEVFTEFSVGWFDCTRPMGRPRHRWDDNIKMDIREIGIDGANWIRLAHDRFQWRVYVNTVINLRVPSRNRLLFHSLSDYQLFQEYPASWSKKET